MLRLDVILQRDWPIKQCLLHISVFFGGKTKRPCFDLFIHWLIKQITSTYRNQFSRSYESRSNRRQCKIILILILFLCFIEGHKFISCFITVTCLPSLNKGVTLPYLTLPYLTLPSRRSGSSKGLMYCKIF